jgi:hypothetical protein
LVLVLLAPSIYLQKWICNLSQGSTDDSLDRDFLKYLITIQEFTICLNISIIHLKEKLKFIHKPFIKINGMLREINF